MNRTNTALELLVSLVVALCAAATGSAGAAPADPLALTPQDWGPLTLPIPRGAPEDGDEPWLPLDGWQLPRIRFENTAPPVPPTGPWPLLVPPRPGAAPPQDAPSQPDAAPTRDTTPPVPAMGPWTTGPLPLPIPPRQEFAPSQNAAPWQNNAAPWQNSAPPQDAASRQGSAPPQDTAPPVLATGPWTLPVMPRQEIAPPLDSAPGREVAPRQDMLPQYSAAPQPDTTDRARSARPTLDQPPEDPSEIRGAPMGRSGSGRSVVRTLEAVIGACTGSGCALPFLTWLLHQTPLRVG
ncbi:hypothetical protein [Nocardia sp. NPDC052566]|uniref:hypothetical protein n=1 Tax=Nocardia sp. NPDC052566 TaxID=3364330 RepID=UPI0037C8683A